MKLKIVFVSGATLGHIFPALNIASRIRSQIPQAEIKFILGKNQRFLEFLSGFDKGFISIKPLYFKKDIFIRAYLFIKSFFESYLILKKNKPNLIISFGSYMSFPVAVMGKFLDIAVIIHEQNIVPGIANRILFNLADYFVISFQESKKFLPNSKKIIYGGILLRPDLNKYTKEQAIKKLNLDMDKFTILVMGGSQGSRNINKVFFECIRNMKRENLQVIHLSGESDFSWLNNEYAKLKIKVYLAKFLEDISLVYNASDLVISRAGAMSVSELAFFGRPSILIPFSGASAHQKENARALLDNNACILLEEDELTPDRLSGAILDFKNRYLDYEVKPNNSFNFDRRENFINKIYEVIQ